MLQFLDLTDNNLSFESIQYIMEGLKRNPNIVSVNLSQNDLGSTCQGLSPVFCLFEASSIGGDFILCASLEELNLSNNALNNKHIEDLS